MDLDPARLRRGEWIAVGSALLLLLFMLLLDWYGLSGTLSPTASSLGVRTSLTGWNALTHLRWLLLLTILAAFALGYLQAARRAPALPATMSLIVLLLALITTLALVYRVLINPPGTGDVLEQRVGAYLGLIASLGITYGGYASLRQEGIAAKDAVPIEDVRLESRPQP